MCLCSYILISSVVYIYIDGLGRTQDRIVEVSSNSRDLTLSFHHEFWGLNLGQKCVYPLSHLESIIIFINYYCYFKEPNHILYYT